MNRRDILAFSYRGIKATERFWKHVKRGGKNDCWEWIGSRKAQGYGIMSACGKAWASHRFSWIVHKGDIPDGMCVLHHCDNPPCVNPCHLFLGTRIDNNLDRIRKHRGIILRGEQSGMSKLTSDQVLAIRTAYANLDVTHLELGIMYGITEGAIKAIIDGKTWKHIGGPIGTKKDAYRNQRGVNARDAKLTEEQVRQFRHMAESGVKGAHIAKQFGLSRSCVYGLIHRKYYSSVSD